MFKALRRAFVEGIIDNDEKLNSAGKHTLVETKMAEIVSLFLIKTAKKPQNLWLQKSL